MRYQRLNLKCCPSKKGLKIFPNKKFGKIIKEAMGGTCFVVIWEGQKTENVIHKSFIKILSQPTDIEKASTILIK